MGLLSKGSVGGVVRAIAAVTVPITPLSEPTLRQWLDAGDQPTMTVAAGKVTAWQDKSPNGYNVTQADINLAPTKGADHLLFQPGVVDHLFSETRLGYSGNPAITNIFVYEAANAPNTYSRVWQIGTSAGNTISNTLSVGELGYRHNNGNNLFAGAGNTSIQIFSYTKAASVDYGGSFVFLNGNSVAKVSSNNSTNNINLTENSLFIGSAFSTDLTVGKMYESISFNSSDNGLRQRMEGFVAHKWGIASKLSASHPYKNSPPIA